MTYQIDINDPFAGLGDDVGSTATAPRRQPGEHLAATVADPTKMWPETCPACKGRGKFVSWGGRVLGDCFKCKGKGQRSFKTAPDDRAKARAYTAARKERSAEANLEAFAQSRPELAAWLEAKAPTFAFAASMRDAVKQWGSLTEKQLAAVERLAAQDAARATQAQARRVDIDASQITEAFDNARATGLSRIKVRLTSPDGHTFIVSPAGATSSNAGALYVKSDDAGDYLGKIVDGSFHPVRACDDERRDAFVAVAADARAAAVAYGRLTGSCSCCGRELTDPNSVSQGIGPICAGKMGW
jgi:hypothetical protein